MKCQDAADLLEPTSLDADDALLLSAHLEECSDCREEAGAYRLAYADFDRKAESAGALPAALKGRVLAQLREEPSAFLKASAQPQTGARPIDAGLAEKIQLSCTYCHAPAKRRSELVFCASCLAPHHSDCLTDNGECSALGCEETRSVAPSMTVPSRRRGLVLLMTALLGGGAVAALVGVDRWHGADEAARLAAEALEARTQLEAREADSAQRLADVKAELRQAKAEVDRRRAEELRRDDADATRRRLEEIRQREARRAAARKGGAAANGGDPVLPRSCLVLGEAGPDAASLAGRGMPSRDQTVIYVIDNRPTMSGARLVYTSLDGVIHRGGIPLDCAKTEVGRSILTLQRTWRFNIALTSGKLWAKRPLLAHDANKQSGIAWTSSLGGGFGSAKTTQVLNDALGAAGAVVFLTREQPPADLLPTTGTQARGALYPFLVGAEPTQEAALESTWRQLATQISPRR
jgi:hypothetical protein